MQSLEALKKLAVFDREQIEHVLFQHNRLRAVARLGDLAEAFSEHAVLEILGDPGMLPYAGRYDGRLAIVDVLQRLAMEVKFLSSEIADLLVDHDRAMMRVSAMMRHRGTGLVLQQEIWDIFTFEAGLIVHQTKHFDIKTFRRLCAGR
jgi:ketosteroid isomerase-like protein